MDKITKFYNDILGTGNELVDSVSLSVEDRLTSPFYGYFITSWMIINWRLIYIAFFVRGEDIYKKTGLISNEYLFLNVPTFGTWTWLLHFFVYPFTVTLFIFWIMPFVTRPYFRKNIKNRKALKLIELNESREIKKGEKELVIAEKNLIKEEVDKAKQIKRASAETPEVLWEKEYLDFKNNPLYKEFKVVISHVFDSGGGGHQGLSVSMIAFLDLNNLGTGNGYNKSVVLNQKGKFFAKKYLEDNPLEDRRNIWV
jgi:hypothetical protein